MKMIKDLGTRGKNKMRYGLFLCDCGAEFETRVSRVKNGTTKSCGCYQKKTASDARKKSTTHGDTGTKLHNRWMGMIARCYQKSSSSYKNYGEKGVTVCDEWKNSYLAFKKWSLSNGFEEHLDIDKDILCNALNISPKIYSPETCMFIERGLNRRVVKGREPTLRQNDGYIEYSEQNSMNKYRGVVSFLGKRYYSKFVKTSELASADLKIIIKGVQDSNK